MSRPSLIEQLRRTGNYKGCGTAHERRKSIYAADNGGTFIHLTFFDVRRFLPEHDLNDFRELRANSEALEALEARYLDYINRGGRIQSTDGSKTFCRCVSDNVLFDVLGQWPQLEWDLFNRQVEDAA